MRIRLRVGKLMKEKGVSIKELAEQANIAPNTARGLYYGITTRIDLPILDRVAKVLGVSQLELFELTNEELRKPRLAAAS
jgi:transcriptional regulator with XRE-family HTH domain